MVKHNKKDNFISLLIGVALALPVSMVAINNPSEASGVPTAPRVEINESAIEDMEVPTRTISNQEPNKTALGDFMITAYCACPKCCGESADGLTYTETRATEGRTIAVDPDVIPLGSKVELGGKTYIAEDIGGAVKGKHIDLFFNSHAEAIKWGRQYKDIYLIEEAN